MNLRLNIDSQVLSVTSESHKILIRQKLWAGSTSLVGANVGLNTTRNQVFPICI